MVTKGSSHPERPHVKCRLNKQSGLSCLPCSHHFWCRVVQAEVELCHAPAAGSVPKVCERPCILTGKKDNAACMLRSICKRCYYC